MVPSSNSEYVDRFEGLLYETASLFGYQEGAKMPGGNRGSLGDMTSNGAYVFLPKAVEKLPLRIAGTEIICLGEAFGDTCNERIILPSDEFNIGSLITAIQIHDRMRPHGTRGD